MTVLDASAVLAFLAGEPGRDVVGRELAAADCCISAVNWSEVWQKGLRHSLPSAALVALAELVEIVAVTRVQGERAAELWSEVPHLSIADRLCLALAAERDEPAMTADEAWSALTDPSVTLIR